MELRVLRYFLAVAREQSISKAAAVLNLSQPTLSTQLKDLEDELGRQLLVRGSRRVTLTEEGMILRKRAQEILSLVAKTEKEVSSSEDYIAGEIYIGAGETANMKYFARAAKRLQQSCPDIRYNILSGNSQFVLEQLDKGIVDFGLLYGGVDPQRYETLPVPMKERWGVLMRADSPLAEKDVITPEDLVDKPLIISQQENAKLALQKWFSRPASDLNIVASYNLILNASFLTLEGLGYTIMFDDLLESTESSTLVCRPMEPAFESEATIIWKKYQLLSRAADRFLTTLRQVFAEG